MNKTNPFLRFLIKNPSSYRILKPLLELFNLREKEPYRIWLRFLIDILIDAFGKKRKAVIWMNSMTPTEIAYAFDAIPIMPEVIASIVSNIGLSGRFLSISEGKLSTDTCSFHRCILGLAMDNLLPRPTVIISSSNICDGANKFYHYLSSFYQCPHLFIDVPYDESESSLKYLIFQLEKIFKDLSEILSIPIDQNRIYKIISNSNHSRSLLEEINKMRQTIPSPFPGSEGLSYLLGMNFWSHGSERAIEFYLALKRFIKMMTNFGKAYKNHERMRILWLHQIRPYYQTEIFKILQRHGAMVSFEEGNYLYWPPLEVKNPIGSIAKKILSNIWQGPLEKRLNAISEMIKDYSINGVIHFSPWGCRQGTGASSIIGDFLKENGIPFLLLPGDSIDPNNYSAGQTRTRLEAFLEIVV